MARSLDDSERLFCSMDTSIHGSPNSRCKCRVPISAASFLFSASSGPCYDQRDIEAALQPSRCPNYRHPSSSPGAPLCDAPKCTNSQAATKCRSAGFRQLHVNSPSSSAFPPCICTLCALSLLPPLSPRFNLACKAAALVRRVRSLRVMLGTHVTHSFWLPHPPPSWHHADN